ncbi:hypothetical protein DW262_03685 [Segatella copri]|uniref:Uncharacterized protein n=1 Tax=Segatella copri TaxID=165179 RepID=A0A3R6ENU9_9BACT|nr:hypothetical protein DW263_00700 [Segatella copri]RHG38901.1 hypothetical protein DW262_03685 [Segatella copri]RHG67349.1 hypothetical protein DW250_04700 [Segatella copri]
MQCVFHSIRFKVIKIGATAVALFYCLFQPYLSIFCRFCHLLAPKTHFFEEKQKKSWQKIWWNQKIVVPLQPLKKTKL